MSAVAQAPIPPIAAAPSRGRTTIADKVFEKITGQVAAEVRNSFGTSGGVLGFGATPDRAARPGVHVDVGPDRLDVSMQLGIDYPQSIRAATQLIRDRVTQRVHHLTGVPVRRVDIEVTYLATGGLADAGASRAPAPAPGTGSRAGTGKRVLR